MKKRVLQFIGSFHQGGSERQAVALTRMMSDEGSLDVRVATLNNEGVLKPQVDSLGLPEVPEFRLASFYDPNFLRQVRRCAKYLRQEKIDLVHTHDFYTNVFGMAAATLAGVPVRVASKRETGVMRSGPQRFVEKIAFGRATAIVANSNAVRDHLIARRIPTDKINVIYNGIGVNGSRKGVPVSSNGKPRVITLVANLRHPVKNIPMLLRAAKRVSGSNYNVQFVIAGEGELRDELQGLAVRLGVARNVEFMGRCDDVSSLLGRSYACVLTSLAEGFSNSLAEYMAAGRPVVATNVGGAGEAIADGKSGFLVDSDDDAAMADRLIELLEHPQMAKAFGVAGKKIAAEKFSQRMQPEKTLDLYNSLLHNA